jgi:hypothetical protein
MSCLEKAVSATPARGEAFGVPFDRRCDRSAGVCAVGLPALRDHRGQNVAHQSGQFADDEARLLPRQAGEAVDVVPARREAGVDGDLLGPYLGELRPEALIQPWRGDAVDARGHRLRGRSHQRLLVEVFAVHDHLTMID